LVDLPPSQYANVTSSPAWIVNYQGQDHVFEGNYDLSRLFNESGKFVAEREP